MFQQDQDQEEAEFYEELGIYIDINKEYIFGTEADLSVNFR